MSHLLENMAFVGATPWHGLGNQLPPKQPLEVWASKAGMDWSIRETPVCYRTNGIDHDHGVLSFEEQKVLHPKRQRRRPVSGQRQVQGGSAS